MLEFSSTNNDCGCNPENLQQFSDPSCPSPSVVTWQSLQGKPSCFTPCAHTHVPGDIIGLEEYIQGIEFATGATSTNSIQSNLISGILSFNLKLSSNAGTGYKVPLSILSDGLIGQIPYASGVSSGILSSTDWDIFNNKFNTPSGTTNQYVRGDGSLATFPTGLAPSGVAGGELAGTYPNPTLLTTAVTGKLLSGLPLFSNTPITSADSILSAFSKIQGQINNKIGGVGTLNYIPKFNSTNTVTNSVLFEDSVGRIGLGTTTPTSTFHIFGNGPRLDIETNTGTGSSLRIRNTTLSTSVLFDSGGGVATTNCDLFINLGVKVYSTGNFQTSKGFAIDSFIYFNTTGNYTFSSNQQYGVVLGPGSDATLTINLPTTPMDGQEIAVLCEEDKTSITFFSLKPIYGHNNGVNISVTITGGAAKGSALLLAKYSSVAVGNTGAWFLSVSE